VHASGNVSPIPRPPSSKEGCLTGPVILGTFRTPEGFAVIKSELVDRISIQNPHLYRQHVEKVVNTIFQRLLPQWHAVTGSNCGGLGLFL
jgi:hypothetical protein